MISPVEIGTGLYYSHQTPKKMAYPFFGHLDTYLMDCKLEQLRELADKPPSPLVGQPAGWLLDGHYILQLGTPIRRDFFRTPSAAARALQMIRQSEALACDMTSTV